jgi:predicted nucleic acid-binding protein
MLALTNQYQVVLDACVLVPMPLCDTLLRLAEEPAFYIPKWSQQILEEVERTLLRWGYSELQAKRRIEAMTIAFPDATVIDHEALIAVVNNHIDDRHVLAAAVKCGANAIVTDNTKDFPSSSLKPYGIERMTADYFLVHQYHFDEDQVMTVLEQQATKSKATLPQLLSRLSVNAPTFVSLVESGQ